MLKLEDNKIYKLIFEHNFAQRLNFSHCERNILINITDVINVNKMKSRELLIKIFLSIFVWMLQFIIIVKFSLIVNFFDLQSGDQFTLNCCDSRTQIYEVINRDRNGESDRNCWSYSDDFGFQEVVAWNGDDFEFGWCSISNCNSIKLTVFKLL